MHHFENRFKHFLHRLETNHLDGFLVFHPPNLRYLFNFTGSTGQACCFGPETYLVVDSRYFEQAQTQAVNCKPVLATGSLEEQLRQLVHRRYSQAHPRRRIGVEANRVPYDFILRMKSWELSVEWAPVTDLIEELRMIKEPSEIEAIEKAFQIAQTAYTRARRKILPGLTELEVAGILEYELRRAGGEGFPFETIVASGIRSALPHGVASAKKLRKDESVLIDFGAKYQGYNSDLTRIELLAEAVPPTIDQVVREAQKRALERIKPGVLSSEIDAAARHWITQEGYGNYFGHGVGHGLGLEIHELPAISPRRPRLIEAGMLFTVEPGIYLPGCWGVRVEDAVVVTEDGYRMLSDPHL